MEFNCREFAQANRNARQESAFAVQSALVFAPWAPGGTEIDAAAGRESELVAGKLTSRTTPSAVDYVLVRTADDNKQEGTI